MPTALKILASGSQSTSGAADIYTATSPKSALITSVVLETGTALTATLLVGGTNTFRCAKADLTTTGSNVISDPITLGPGERLRLALSTNSPVQYAVMGLERT